MDFIDALYDYLKQEKKKMLANELVSEDAGFTKQLTREDVAFLFS